jgi:hypothetical protein
MSRFVLGFAIISGLCLISYSVYDYYIIDALNGLELYLIFTLGWLISFIFSIIYAFKKTSRRIGLYSIVVNITSILLIFVFFLIIPKTSLKRYTLPRKITSEDLKKSDFISYSNDSTYYIVLMHKESDMAFGSGHNILGLYTQSNKIVDECIFGEFPISFDSWKGNTIVLETKPYNKDSYNIQYINYWIERNKKIKNFNIDFIVE